MNKRFKTTLFCVLAHCIVETGFAETAPDTSNANCWQNAGIQYDIDPWLLFAIASVESDMNPLAVNTNSDGTVDVGLMQINSFWFDRLSEFGFDEDDLYDPCNSIMIGAWILAESRSLYGSHWRALGAYNAGTGKALRHERQRFTYAKRVLYRYHSLTQRLRSSSAD